MTILLKISVQVHNYFKYKSTAKIDKEQILLKISVQVHNYF